MAVPIEPAALGLRRVPDRRFERTIAEVLERYQPPVQIGAIDAGNRIAARGEVTLDIQERQLGRSEAGGGRLVGLQGLVWELHDDDAPRVAALDAHP